MTKMPLKINGVDFSAMTERCGYSISYEDRAGANSMTMQNGDQILDVIAQKPVLSWRLDSLTNSQLSQLISAISAAVYVSIFYFDTKDNTTKTALFHCTISEQEVGVIGASGYYRFKAPTLTCKAR